MATFLDISPPLSSRLAVWPGDAPFVLERSLSHETDGICLSSLRATLHAGAHADAPSHVLSGGQPIDAMPLDPYFGVCEVIEVRLPPGTCVLPEHVPSPIGAPRVLFKTDPCRDPERFDENFVSLSPELIHHLRAQGCLLVGMDTPSLDPFSSQDLPAHHALFEAGMCNLENLVLTDVEPGLYTLIALPLRVEGGDGSPVRAVLVKD